MKSQKTKSPRESEVETRYLLTPHKANPHDTAFGGVIMVWLDILAAMPAQKHCEKEMVNAGVESLIFKESIRIGDYAVLKIH